MNTRRQGLTLLPNIYFNVIKLYGVMSKVDIKICKVHTVLKGTDPLTKPLPQAKHKSNARRLIVLDY